MEGETEERKSSSTLCVVVQHAEDELLTNEGLKAKMKMNEERKRPAGNSGGPAGS